MKKLLLIALMLACGIKLCAQKIEYSIQANTGILFYSGRGSVKNTAFVQSYNDEKQNSVKQPYSRIGTTSYGFNGQAQLVTKTGFIAGLQAGYEILRSKSNIDTVYPAVFTIYYNINSTYISPLRYESKGSAVLTNRYINLNPYIGYRFTAGNSRFDVLPGADIGIGTSSSEKGKAVADDQTYLADTTMKKPLLDVRVKLGVVASYKHYGFTASYAHGLSNYYREDNGTNLPKVYSELFRFGVSYRF